MTQTHNDDNELDEILDSFRDWVSNKDFGASDMQGQLSPEEAKQQLLAWKNRQVAEALDQMEEAIHRKLGV